MHPTLTAEDLRAYQAAYALAMQVFVVSKSFPVEERYALTDQVRRSSRSVCTNLVEAWAKRRYPAHFTRPVKYNALRIRPAI